MPAATPPLSIQLFAIAALAGALGQYLYKSGADATDSSIMSYVLNPRLLGGIVCYVAVMVLFVAAFKKGGSLAVLYPIYVCLPFGGPPPNGPALAVEEHRPATDALLTVRDVAERGLLDLRDPAATRIFRAIRS